MSMSSYISSHQPPLYQAYSKIIYFQFTAAVTPSLEWRGLCLSTGLKASFKACACCCARGRSTWMFRWQYYSNNSRGPALGGEMTAGENNSQMPSFRGHTIWNVVTSRYCGISLLCRKALARGHTQKKECEGRRGGDERRADYVPWHDVRVDFSKHLLLNRGCLSSF
jgi:hypothetical protein